MSTSFSPNPGFNTTHWSEVALAAGSRDIDKNRDALGRLTEAYRPALEGFLVRHYRMDASAAEELVQQFFVHKILGKNLLAEARKELGRFRTFLLRSFRNFVADELDKTTAQARRPEGGFVHGSDGGLVERVAAPDDPVASLNAEWARAVLGRAAERMHAECVKTTRMDIWRVFEGRIWRELLLRKSPIDRNILITELGITAKQLDGLQTTAKRSFRRAVRSTIAEYARGDEQNELRHLIESLGRSTD